MRCVRGDAASDARRTLIAEYIPRARVILAALIILPERPAEASHIHGGASACDWTERLFTPKLGIFFI